MGCRGRGDMTATVYGDSIVDGARLELEAEGVCVKAQGGWTAYNLFPLIATDAWQQTAEAGVIALGTNDRQWADWSGNYSCLVAFIRAVLYAATFPRTLVVLPYYHPEWVEGICDGFDVELVDWPAAATAGDVVDSWGHLSAQGAAHFAAVLVDAVMAGPTPEGPT